MAIRFNPGFDIEVLHDKLDFRYGPGVFGPKVEQRKLDAIRSSLRDPACTGPDVVYAIAMDVGKTEHKEELQKRMLLYGVVTYASGKLGEEPIRSQGHIHKISSHSGWSPPEIYEIWSGKAFIYMQERAADDPGRCYAIQASPGDVVIVPPEWAHATISANPDEPLTFGAWCDREYGFEYDEVRRHKGLAWYPLIGEHGQMTWSQNPNYMRTSLTVRPPRDYKDFGIVKGEAIYTQFERDADVMQFVSNPALKEDLWSSFEP